MRVRIGNDFVFLWSIERNGKPENLNECLQKVLEEDRQSISMWYINEDCDMAELKRILVGNNIKYKIKEWIGTY